MILKIDHIYCSYINRTMALTIAEKDEIIRNAIHIIGSDYKLMKKFASLVKRLSNKYNLHDDNITNVINIYYNAMNRYNECYETDQFDSLLTDEEAKAEDNSIILNLNYIFENSPITFLLELKEKLKSNYYIY